MGVKTDDFGDLAECPTVTSLVDIPRRSKLITTPLKPQIHNEWARWNEPFSSKSCHCVKVNFRHLGTILKDPSDNLLLPCWMDSRKSEGAFQNCTIVCTVELHDSSIARKTAKMTFDIFQNQKYILIDISYIIYKNIRLSKKSKICLFGNSWKLLNGFRKVKQVYFCHFGIQIGNWFENNWGIKIPRSQILVFESNVKAMAQLQSYPLGLPGFSLKTLKYLLWRGPVWSYLQSISYCDITEPVFQDGSDPTWS